MKKLILLTIIALGFFFSSVHSQTSSSGPPTPIQFMRVIPPACVPTSRWSSLIYKFTADAGATPGAPGLYRCSGGTFTAVGASGVAVGTTTSDGTANTLLKTGGSGTLTNATGLTNTSTQELMITSQAATNVPFTVRGHATQSGNLFVVEDSAGTDFAFADSFGRFNLTDYLTIRYNTEIRAGFQYATGFIVAPTYKYAFSSVNSLDSGVDTALERSAAGVVKVTDGASAIRGLLGGGTAVASAAALPLPTGRVFHVTGTTNITSITSTNFGPGAVITLIFDDILTLTDGNNLVIAGNFVTTTSDTITLVFDGTNWHETARAVN